MTHEPAAGHLHTRARRTCFVPLLAHRGEDEPHEEGVDKVQHATQQEDLCAQVAAFVRGEQTDAYLGGCRETTATQMFAINLQLQACRFPLACAAVLEPMGQWPRTVSGMVVRLLATCGIWGGISVCSQPRP